jgi:hypothetical protein
MNAGAAMLDALGAGWALRRVIRFLLRRALGRILQPESLDAHQARPARDAPRAQPRDVVSCAWRSALVPLAPPLRSSARCLLEVLTHSRLCCATTRSWTCSSTPAPWSWAAPARSCG